MKKIIIWIVVLLLVILGIYLLVNSFSRSVSLDRDDQSQAPTATTTPAENKEQTTIGNSVLGKPIIAYHFGTGSDEVLLIGGIHGGYEWNTSVVAYNLINSLKNSSLLVPANLKVTVVPVLNPDGLSQITSITGSFTSADISADQDKQVAGRFNGNNVDLNRNFDCDWQASAK